MAEQVEDACKKFLKLSASKEPGDVINGLNLFLKQADVVEFLEQYAKISRDFGELCTVLQWDKQQRTNNVLTVCFRCIEQVCLKSASADASADLKLAGHNLATNLISNHIKIFYSSLSLSAPNVLTAIALRLLTSVVTQGSSVAQELLHSFNFSYKPLEILPTKVGDISKKTGSIRLCFIQFAVSFLVVGTSDVIQEILSLKGFLSLVFTLLPNDNVEVVYLVLSTLREKVVESPNISKRVKSAFFTHTILAKISLLFSRKEEIQLNECVMYLSDYCRDFILKLCTDFQLGICYKSKGSPSSWRRSNNPALLQFLLSLKNANEGNSHEQQIVMAALRACPDLVISYLNGLSYTFEPKLSSRWITNVEFILQVYSSITKVSQILQHVTHEQLMSCVDTAVSFTVPPCISRNVLSQGIQNGNPLVKSTVMSLLLMILSRSGDVIEWYNNTKSSSDSSEVTGDDFLTCYCDSVLKFLPDIKTIISLRQLLTNADQLKVFADIKNELLHTKHKAKNTELADGVLLREQTLEILCGYQRLSHDILSASGFDLTKLLPSVMTSNDLPENLLLILSLLSGAPVGTLKWYHAGCWQLGKAISVPPTAILGGLLILTSFVISPAVINVPKTDWIEPTLIWLTINMPTGSRKTTVYQLLLRILQQIRQAVNLESSSEPIWLLQDATFEKMGALMAQNGGRLCGMFDELTALLTKLKLYSNRGLSDSHELAMFLELYNGNSWTRSTVAKLAKLWKKSTVKEIPTTAYYLPDDETQMATFTQKYDEVQKQLQTIAAMDDLLSGVRHIAIQITSSFSNIIGMLSKSLGQTLRISVAMHILFHNDDDGDELSNTVTQAAVEAAINFVEVCCQHTAYIAGRNDINEQLKLFETGTIVESPTIQKSTESFVLTLPGQCLDVSMLVNIKKRFRKRGGREGALQAMRELMKDGMGELKEKKNKGSIKKNHLLSSLMYIMYLEDRNVAIVASRVVKKLINVLPICCSEEVDILMTSLLSQLQCRIYTTDRVSSLIAALVDGLKCLAYDPLQYVDDNLDDLIRDAMQDHMVSLESILASDLEFPVVSTEEIPPPTSDESTVLSSSLINPIWLMLLKQCSTKVQLLPLIAEVFLKLLIITDQPATVADVILHHLGNTIVAKEFMSSSTKWIYYDFICCVVPWKSVKWKDLCSLAKLFNEGDEMKKPLKHIKKILQSDINVEASLFEYMSLFPSVELTKSFSDVWKLCYKKWNDESGSVFLQQFLNIRPLKITGVNFSSPLTLLLQCLPKEPKEAEDKSCEVTKVKRKKTEESLTQTYISESDASIWLTNLTTEKLEDISKALSRSDCKEMFCAMRLFLKNIKSLKSHAQEEGKMEVMTQLYDLLRILLEKILSNKCTVCNNNLFVKCDSEECSCSLIINAVFNNLSLQENFLTQSPITNSKLQQPLLVRKRKHVSQIEAACSANSMLICDLITTCLKMQPQMTKASCLRFYFAKINETLTAQDFAFIIASSAQKIFKQIALYMESKTVSVILDQLLTNMSLAIASNKLVEDAAVEILVNLQLENHTKYFMLSHSGFISLLNICNSCNTDKLDKLLLDILSSCIHKPQSKLTQSKDGKMLANVLDEIYQNTPSLSKILDSQSDAKYNLVDSISTDVIMNWITNPSVNRVNMVYLVINHSKRHWQHFITRDVDCLSDNVSEANVCLYLPLIRSLTEAKESIMSKCLTKIIWNYCSKQLLTSSNNQETCSYILIKLAELQKPGSKKISKLFTKLKDMMTNNSQWNNHQLTVVGKLVSLMTDNNAVELFLLYCMKQFSVALASECDPPCDEELLLTTMLSVLKREELAINDLVLSKWNSFVKLILKHSLHSTIALNLLNCFIKHLYLDDNSQKIISIGDIYEMIWSHSQFLDIILSPIETDNLVKENLVQLLLTTFDADRCTKYHYAVLLAAYHPTMEIPNQHIIRLMQQYEINGVDTSEFSPYLWGKTAVNQFKERQKKGWVLCKQPGMAEVLDMFDKNVIKQSIANFPINVSLEPCEVHDCFHNAELKELYDPRFLLPLFSHLLSSGNIINCRKFVSHGCVGYLVAALSCLNHDIRAAACHCLSRFYLHLEGSRFREKDQIVLLLDILRNSITMESNRISCVHSLFLCRCLEVFLTPDHDMYLVLANFMVYKPALDLQEVPMFYLLVHSSSNKHKLERLWIISLLKEGLRSDCDYPVYRKRSVIPILMTHYSSLLTDSSMKLQILLLIKEASLLNVIATDLVWNKGLLAWLHFVADSSTDNNKLSLLCEIINNIWNSVGRLSACNEPEKLKDTLYVHQSVESKQRVHVPHIEHDMALVLLCLQQKLCCKNS